MNCAGLVPCVLACLVFSGDKSNLTEILESFPSLSDVAKMNVAEAISRQRHEPTSANIEKTVDCMMGADAFTASRLQMTIANMGPKAVPILVQSLGKKGYTKYVLGTLREFGPMAAEAAPHVVQLLASPGLANSKEERQGIKAALVSIGPKAIPSVRKALGRYSSSEDIVLLDSLVGMYSLIDDDKASIAEIAAVIQFCQQSNSRSARLLGLELLGRTTVDHPSARSLIEEFITENKKSPDDVDRLCAAVALSGRATPKVVAFLCSLLESRDPQLARAGLEAVSVFNNVGVFSDQLVKLSKSKHSEFIQTRALQLLTQGEIDDKLQRHLVARFADAVAKNESNVGAICAFALFRSKHDERKKALSYLQATMPGLRDDVVHFITQRLQIADDLDQQLAQSLRNRQENRE